MTDGWSEGVNFTGSYRCLHIFTGFTCFYMFVIVVYVFLHMLFIYYMPIRFFLGPGGVSSG